MNKTRLCVTIAILAAVAAGVLWIPLPHYVTCYLTLQPREAAFVYVDAPGRLAEIHAAPGDYIAAGSPLATLANIDPQLRIEELQSRRQELLSRLDGLRRAAFDAEQAAQEIGETEKALEALDEQLARRQRDIERLTVAAPISGTVIAPPRIAPPESGDEHLTAWSGFPLEHENLGAFLSDGVLLCQVGDPRKLEAILAVDQAQIEFLRPGQQIDLVLEPLRGQKFTTRLEHISQAQMQGAPKSLASQTGGNLATTIDPAGRLRPVAVTYEASAPLDDADGALVPGATGAARIHAGQRTIGQRLWRSLCATFNVGK